MPTELTPVDTEPLRTVWFYLKTAKKNLKYRKEAVHPNGCTSLTVRRDWFHQSSTYEGGIYRTGQHTGVTISLLSYPTSFAPVDRERVIKYLLKDQLIVFAQLGYSRSYSHTYEGEEGSLIAYRDTYTESSTGCEGCNNHCLACQAMVV